PSKQQHTGIVTPHPDPAFAVLVHRVRLVAGQTLGLAIHRENIVAPAFEPGTGADPKIALPIFKQRPHKIAAIVAAKRRDEAVLFQPGQPVVGAGPDIAVAVGPQCAHDLVGKTIAHAVPAYCAIHPALDHAVVAANPEA